MTTDVRNPGTVHVYLAFVHLGNDAKKTAAVLLGLSGCGKTSALNPILARAGGRHAVDEAPPEAPPAHPGL